MTTHTKLPWSLAGNYAILTRFGLLHDLYRPEYSVEQMDEVEANAALIVHRVNGWDEQQAKIDELVACVQESLESRQTHSCDGIEYEWAAKARAAITRAKGV